MAAAGGAGATSMCSMVLLLDADNLEPWTEAATWVEKHNGQKKVVRSNELRPERWQLPAVLQPPLHAT